VEEGDLAGVEKKARRARAWLVFQDENGTSLIGFLKDLKKHFRRQPVLLIWDGLPAHRGREMQEFLAAQQARRTAVATETQEVEA